MPKGIPNNKEASATPPQFLKVALRPEDYQALLDLAAEQYRTPELQAAWLLARVLSEAGRTSNGTRETAERIIARAQARNNGDTE